MKRAAKAPRPATKAPACMWLAAPVKAAREEVGLTGEPVDASQEPELEALDGELTPVDMGGETALLGLTTVLTVLGTTGAAGELEAETGQTVVETGTMTVTMEVEPEPAGQLVTVGAQEVTVLTLVE